MPKLETASVSSYQPALPVEVSQAIHETIATTRNISVDAYRGFVMLLMMAEVLHLATVAKAFPNNWIWQTLAFQQSHVEWAGCSLHDLIQPSFSFLVGVALPYSLASRLGKNITFSSMLRHTIWRSFLLICLGIFLRSLHSSQTYFTFEDTLTQIGLGYTFLFLLGFCSKRWLWVAFGFILFSYWLAWALYPVPTLSSNYQAVGVPTSWHHNFSGFSAHWNKNANLGTSFDQWFLNLFPRQHSFVANGGGYLTLSFIPTLATMILGLIAGKWLRASAPRIPFRRFFLAGTLGITLGLLLHFAGICPIVKRIWTPSWTLFSGGICFLLLAAFHWLVEVKGQRRLAFPLLVVGINSMAAYLIAHLCEDFIRDSFHIHLGNAPFQVLGTALQPLLLGISLLCTYWLILYWMYQRKIFLRI